MLRDSLAFFPPLPLAVTFLTLQPIQIPTNSSLPTPPFPSKSNSSTIASNSSSSIPSPSSRATRLKSSIVIIPLSSVSKSANALNISSRGCLLEMRSAAMVWKAGSVRRRREGGMFCCGGGREEGPGGGASGEMPWV